MSERKEVEIKNENMFLAEALIQNQKTHKLIKKYYKEKQEECIKASKNNKYIFDGDIKKEDLFRKALGVISCYEDETIVEIIKEGFKKEVSFVESSKVVKLTNFFDRNKMTKQTVDEINASALIIVVLINLYKKEVDIDDPLYFGFSNSLFLRDNMKTISYNDFTKEEKKYLRKIELNFKKIFKYDVPVGFYPTNDENYVVLEKMETYEKQIFGLDYIYDMEHISMYSLIGSKKLTSKEIQELIYNYFTSWTDEDGNKLSFIDDYEEIDYARLFEFMIPAMQIRYLVKAYNAAKKYYFEKVDENAIEEKKIKAATVKKLQQENTSLADENKRLREQLKFLESENNKLTKKVESLSENDNELHQLRNLMFSLNQDVADEVETVDIEKIDSIKAVCFGGTDKWIAQMKEVLPSWTFVAAGVENFDVKLLDRKYIAVNTVVNSHGMYYRIVENRDKSSNLLYINNTNIEKVLKQIESCL